MLAWLLMELVLVVIAGSLMVWGLASLRFYRGEDVVPYAPRRVVPWGVAHLILLMAGVLLLQSLAWLSVTAGPETQITDLSPTERLRVTSAVGLASLLATLAGAGLLVAAAGATRRDLGLPDGWTTLASDLKLGLLGFLAAALPVYAIQLLIVLIHHRFGEAPTDHPLVEMLRDSSDSGTLAVAVLVAVCVAPIFEEFVFRLVLQGWLEKLATRWAGAGVDQAAAVPHEPVAADQTMSDPPGDLLPCPADSADPCHAAAQSQSRAIWPIVGSAALFAAMHLGHGFDPIPLFFLALCLGYLYYRTHRIIPCIVMHALFNAFSLAMLGLPTE